MKSFVGFSCILLVASGVALAQPGATSPPPGPGAGSGSNVPQPAPTPNDGSGSDEQPQWLPGLPNVTGDETAQPGKLLLSMKRAVELALEQHPTLRQQQAAAEAAYGRVDQAGVPTQPTLTLAGTLGASSKPQQPCNMGDTALNCGGFDTHQEATGLSATAAWKITDFGVTRLNVRAADLTAVAADAGVSSTKLDLRLAVETAYLQAIAEHRLVVVAESTVKSDDAHFDQAKRFVAAGQMDPIVVAQASSTLAAAKSALAQAQSTDAIALANLRAAIGWMDPNRTVVIDANWPVTAEEQPPELPQLVDSARKRRPDIMQLDKLITAADASLDAAHAERRPTLSATADIAYGPQTGNWSPQPSWGAGLTLSWLAWDGGKSRADVKVAVANEHLAMANRDALLLTLTSTLESARAQIIANRSGVSASNEAVISAQAALKLAEARYAQGLGSQIELADAQTAVTTAQGALVTAEFQLATAWATLHRAAGDI